MKEIKSLYIHFPYCREICNYCDFYKRRYTSSDDFTIFEQQLEKNFQEYVKLCEKYEMKQSSLETLYLGGGTPSLWGRRGVDFLAKLFTQYGISLDKGGEFTVEFNPEDISQELIDCWHSWGANRFSIGIQSLDDKTLGLIGRTHKKKDIVRSLEVLGKTCDNYSFDLMLGLPYSSKRKLNEELETLVKFEPKHLSVYMMTVGANYPYAKHLPEELQLEQEYLFTSKYLQQSGFTHYEISNFAQSGYESRHNLQYWRGGPMGALGGSATGYFPLGKGALRYRWLVSSVKYREEHLDFEQLQIEKFYLGLRINDAALWTELKQKKYFDNFWSWLNKNNFARSDNFQLNSKGYLMLDSIMDKLFELEAC
jgi:oxygen-independent coproporphyrinogen-3 oxidase